VKLSPQPQRRQVSRKLEIVFYAAVSLTALVNDLRSFIQ
jgi:hypothetical protein